jgi:oligogalacturonide lyase
MKQTIIVSILILLLIRTSAAQSASGVGTVIPGEMKRWIDDTTKFEITQWTANGQSNHPYFTVDSFINDSTAIIFSDRTGLRQLYRLQLSSGAMTQMTEAKKLWSQIDHLPKFKTLWYMDGKILRSLNTTTLQSTTVYDFSDFPYTLSSISVSCDAKWFIFSTEKKDSLSGKCGYGPYAIYKLDLNEKKIIQITHELGLNISHVQANPVDPNLVLYCWQWEKFDEERLVGHAPIRTWWVNIQGTDGGPFLQEFGTQRTHEAWTPDGKNITFVSKYRWGAKKGKHFMGIQSIDGSVNERYWEQVSPGHQNLFKDNQHWIVDMFNNDEQLLALFKRGKKGMDERTVLFRHGSSMLGQNSHPHPRFSTDGTYVLFSTDRTGAPQVYTVKTDLSKKQNRK